MRKRQRRDSAREWIHSGAKVTMKAYAKRYGVDMYTAYEDLTAVGFALPPSAERWAQRPPPTSRRVAEHLTDDVDHDWWIMLDGRTFFVAGYTAGGAPYGIYDDEMAIGAEALTLQARAPSSYLPSCLIDSDPGFATWRLYGEVVGGGNGVGE
jgi:hypothetical protein